MVEHFHVKENRPFPNSTLPVLYYPDVLKGILGENFTDDDVLSLFEKYDYSNGWTGGIHPFHHFHSNTHEVLGCLSGEANVQLGGPDADIYPFSAGDVLLLPAGTSHKKNRCHK